MTPVTGRSLAGFIARVQAAFTTDPLGDAEAAIGAVLDVLDAHVSGGEMAHVRGTFTKEIRALFVERS
jgi:uncharacterized protein (DUF2267 family)